MLMAQIIQQITATFIKLRERPPITALIGPFPQDKLQHLGLPQHRLPQTYYFLEAITLRYRYTNHPAVLAKRGIYQIIRQTLLPSSASPPHTSTAFQQ